jgi:hypothetical protein
MQNWNAPEDPPVFSFGYNFNTRTSLSLPSDFPIIRADTTNDTTIASTMWRWETGIFQAVSGYRTRIGTRVRLLRENLSVYTRSVNYYWGNTSAPPIWWTSTNWAAIASYWRFPISPTKRVDAAARSDAARLRRALQEPLLPAPSPQFQHPYAPNRVSSRQSFRPSRSPSSGRSMRSSWQGLHPPAKSRW